MPSLIELKLAYNVGKNIGMGKMKGEGMLSYIVGAVVGLLVLFLLWPIVANQRNSTVSNANTTGNETTIFNIVGVFVAIGVLIGFLLKVGGHK